MTNFKVDVTSDTVCPWCYVGRKQLQQAEHLWREGHPDSDDTFSVDYRPFQLNPHWPKGPDSSTDKQEQYIKKFGEARTEQMHDRLRQVGEQLGIDFKFGGRTGNSRDSHRLVRLSKKYGHEVDGKTIDGLFAAYFEKEQDITNYEVLRGIAVQAGIPENEFQKAIVESDEGGDEVDKMANEATLMGVTGVPHFVLQNRFSVSGAVSPSTFLSAFERIKELEK